ncbi:MAG: DM13 domain-containing protein [Rhodobacteraceae bacterium]|nr:DM13 domain-containing protein [Paracoccaceae bacterium]
MTTLPVISLLAVALITGCAAPSATSKAGGAPLASVTSANALTTAVGGFEGKSNHITRGDASIQRIDGEWYVALGENFFFDGAPDPKVALGANGYRSDAILSPLRANNGAQMYKIPASLDVADYDQIWIWCEKFNVPLGVADLSLT